MIDRDIVGATHKFHDEAYAEGWADKFRLSPERLQSFEKIGDLVSGIAGMNGKFLELGTGPGYLAEYLLTRFDSIKYHCVDFSEPMIQIAERRLGGFSPTPRFIRADLTNDWAVKVSANYDAIVTTWALHDLGSRQYIHNLYLNAKKVLAPGGLLVNVDFIKPEGVDREYEHGRLSVSEHLELLQQSGYTDAWCAGNYEINILTPTPSNNYSCIVAQK
jgi:SAM-dependent methyltransferase